MGFGLVWIFVSFMKVSITFVACVDSDVVLGESKVSETFTHYVEEVTICINKRGDKNLRFACLQTLGFFACWSVTVVLACSIVWKVGL